MSNAILKKVIIGITVPIFILIIGWATWITKQAFSAQQTKFIFQEHKINDDKNYLIVQQEFNELKNIIQQNFDNLNEKIDKNILENNKILLDLQKQIGQLNH